MLSVLFVHSFTRQVTMPCPEYLVYIDRHDGIGRNRSPSQQIPTMWWFTKHVLNFPDVFGLIALPRSGDEEQQQDGS